MARMHRLTLACPLALIPSANQFALVTGDNPADVATFQDAHWRDSEGNAYAVISNLVSAAYVSAATAPLSLPEHAPDADLAAAQAVQAGMVLCSAEAPVAAAPGVLTAMLTRKIVGTDQGDIMLMGLEHIGAV